MSGNAQELQINLPAFGWREWVALPDLGIPAIKAKVDTGARTSALHAFSVETYLADGRPRVRFAIHPLQRRKHVEIYSEADVIDEREVSDSGGHRENRLVICTPIEVGGKRWPIELTLTSRDTMMFRMLLGRTAVDGRCVVNPGESFLTGRALSRIYRAKKPKSLP